MTDSVENPNAGQPGRGFRLITEDGTEKFLPIPIPLAQGVGQPPTEPPEAPPATMEPAPEEPERKSEQKIEETVEAKITRLEKEYADLVSALYWVETQLSELREMSGT